MKARVPLFRTSPVRSVVVDTEATQGATVGVDLRWQDGSLVAESDIRNAQARSSTPAGQGQDLTTDDVAEGGSLYFTAQRAEDAVGGILANSANVTLTYAGNAISADLTDVTPAGGGTLQKLAFDTKGRLSQSAAATTDDLAEGATALYFTDPRVYSAAKTQLIAGANVTITANDAAHTLTVASSGAGLDSLITDAGDAFLSEDGADLLVA